MNTLRSNRIFKVDTYGSIHAASGAAMDYAKQFSWPWRHRFNQPLLWVKYDNAVDGYVIEPNLEPVQNLAWNDLVAYELTWPGCHSLRITSRRPNVRR